MEHLSTKFNVNLLTVSSNLNNISEKTNVITIPELIPPLPIHDSPRLYSTMPLKTVFLKNTLKRIKPDLLIGCNGLDYGFSAALSGYKPFILFIWGSEVLFFPSFIPLRAMVKYSLKKADNVVVDSQIQFKACVELGCDPEKILKFPWFDSEEFLKQVKDIKKDEQFIRKVGWDEEDPIIICLRSHEPIYHIECIIESIPAVLKWIKNVRFIFVGKGSLTNKLKQKARSLKVERSVYFTGYIPHKDIPYYLKQSDIYVSSSLSDGTSASLLEAMSCKLPCITSEIPANKEWIENMENGLLFPVKDSENLAKKIILLIGDNALCKKLSENAVKTVIERANWSQNSKILYDSIERLTTHNPPSCGY